jgi:hypothetical protein
VAAVVPAVAAVVPAVALLLVPAVGPRAVPAVALLRVPVVVLLLVPVVKSPVARARPLDRSSKTGVRSSQTPVSHDRTWPGRCPHQSLFCALPRPSCRLRVLAVLVGLAPWVLAPLVVVVVPQEPASFCETHSLRPTRVPTRLESQSRPCRTQRVRVCARVRVSTRALSFL